MPRATRATSTHSGHASEPSLGAGSVLSVLSVAEAVAADGPVALRVRLGVAVLLGSASPPFPEQADARGRSSRVSALATRRVLRMLTMNRR